MKQSYRLKANFRPWLSIGMTLFLFHLFLYQSSVYSSSRNAEGVIFIVETTYEGVDTAPGDGLCHSQYYGLCTLRAAVQEANALPGADTINIPMGLFLATRCCADEDAAAGGDLDITDDLTIIGQGATFTLIKGFDRLVQISGVNVTIRGVTLFDGSVSGEGGGLKNDGGTVTLIDVVVGPNIVTQDDSGLARGGGIYSNGDLNITNSRIEGNEVIYNAQNQVAEGGGIYSDGILRIQDSEFSQNTISHETYTSGSVLGGAISSRGTLEITGTSLADNAIGSTLGKGGGVYSEGSLSIRNSYFLQNINGSSYQGGGGAIATADGTSFTLIGSTLEANEAYKNGCGIMIEGGTATIRNSVITDHSDQGSCESNGGGITIYAGELTVFNTTFVDNTAQRGGGIYNLDAEVSIIASSFVNSDAYYGSGGGLYNETGSVRIIGTTFDNGTAEYEGGNISNVSGTLDIIGSTISRGDTEFVGGGISNGGNVRIVDSTFSDNEPDAIYNTGNGVVRLIASTISFRDEFYTDFGISNLDETGVVEMVNSIIVANENGSACAGFPITSLGHNIATDASCNLTAPGDQPNTEPLLGPLQDNGGPTLTHALLAGSPALDTGDNSACPRRDQRGVRRPQDGDGDGVAVCDIGAYEEQP